MPSNSPKKALDLVKQHDVKIVDVKFMDFIGVWQHFSIPVSELTDDIFENGLGFDGSSIRGWRAINESDMLVIPDAETAIIDPFQQPTTLSLVDDIHEPVTKERFGRCPRGIAVAAENYLKSTGLADTAYFGPEAEFFIFDDVRYDQGQNFGFFHLDSVEAIWNRGREEKPNLGYKIRNKEGYFPVPPTDQLQNIRNEMVMVMEACGIPVERQHHEVATAGQAEIDFRFDSLKSCADKLMLFKYIVKNVAFKNNRTATFMPKPLFGDNGSGMHVHMSLWKNGQPLFAGNQYAGLSEMAQYFIGGILKHTKALNALANPTTNSYKRLTPGFEAPVNLAYSQSNRSAAIRIPMYSPSPKAKRVEFRCPDPSCNPYLAFSAMLLAGLDGVINKIHPGEPLDKNIYDLEPEELAKVPSTCASLEEALNALEDDHDFLLKGDVFSADVIETWVKYKRENEVNALRLRPHPFEFALYYDM
ncbi:MAG: type I glutamate--ammonia ligase [Bacteroidetes bacterium]|nr:type I glutamate--ammonia ligase [Bacteroidota bacterium]